MSSEVTPPPGRAGSSGRPAEGFEPGQTTRSTAPRGGAIGGEESTDPTTVREPMASETGSASNAADSDNDSDYGSTASHERPMREYDTGRAPDTGPAQTTDAFHDTEGVPSASYDDRGPREPATATYPTAVGSLDSRAVVAAQRDRFGGMKFGACFFGWLTATGTAVLLTGLLTAVGAGVGLGRNLSGDQALTEPRTVGLVGAVVLIIIIFVSYVAGGYVAGRMARFNGVKQGFGVWLWAIVVAVVLAIVSAIAGARYNVLGTINGFPRVPLDEGTLTVGGLIVAVVAVVAALTGAVVGGIAGMRFHRRVDRATHDADRGLAIVEPPNEPRSSHRKGR